MNTSGVDEPPEIWVASVARLVSVSVDADTRVTLMPGYCFSNALISTVRASLAPVPVSGLADHTIEPDVALPGADDAPLAARPCCCCAAAAGGGVLLLLPLLPQPARTNAPAAPTRAVSCQPLRWRLPGYLRDPIFPPLKVVIP